MPPKDCKEMKFVLMAKDGGVIDLPNEIPELQLEPEQLDEEYQRIIESLCDPVRLECSFDMTVRPVELFFVWSGVCTWEQIHQNNWRRFHGLPMRRKRL